MATLSSPLSSVFSKDYEILSNVSSELEKFYYFTEAHIDTWHDKISRIERREFESFNHVFNLVDKLYRAMHKSELVPTPSGSRGAHIIEDAKTKEKLFIVKQLTDKPMENGLRRPEMPEDFGVPSDGVIDRERLYYELDRNRFAGVPFTILMRWNGLESSLQLYVEDQHPLFSFTDPGELKILAPSLRKCAIHQFRTVNMDPNSTNILINSNCAFPIDGGFSLPYTVDSSKENSIEIATILSKENLDTRFTAEEVEYIRSLDIDADVKILESSLLEETNLQTQIKIFRVANMILKEAVRCSEEDFSLGKNANQTITLSDVLATREIYVLNKKSLYTYALGGKNEKEILSRIDQIFDLILSLKSQKEVALQGLPLENLLVKKLVQFYQKKAM